MAVYTDYLTVSMAKVVQDIKEVEELSAKITIAVDE